MVLLCVFLFFNTGSSIVRCCCEAELLKQVTGSVSHPFSQVLMTFWIGQGGTGPSLTWMLDTFPTEPYRCCSN